MVSRRFKYSSVDCWATLSLKGGGVSIFFFSAAASLHFQLRSAFYFSVLFLTTPAEKLPCKKKTLESRDFPVWISHWGGGGMKRIRRSNPEIVCVQKKKQRHDCVNLALIRSWRTVRPHLKTIFLMSFSAVFRPFFEEKKRAKTYNSFAESSTSMI